MDKDRENMARITAKDGFHSYKHNLSQKRKASLTSKIFFDSFVNWDRDPGPYTRLEAPEQASIEIDWKVYPVVDPNGLF